MKKYEGYTDEELIHMLRDGNEEIMYYLLDKYKNLVIKKTNALYLIGGDKDDLIQEGTIGLFKAIRDFDENKESSFFHFAHICVTRQLASALEASNRKKHRPLNEYVSLSTKSDDDESSLEDFIGIDEDSPEKLILEKEQTQEFWNKIRSNLSKMENNVLDLYLDGYNYNQIADLMKKSPKAIDNALQRIRQKVRIIK